MSATTATATASGSKSAIARAGGPATTSRDGSASASAEVADGVDTSDDVTGTDDNATFRSPVVGETLTMNHRGRGMGPPQEVLDAWGITSATRLPGGQGTVYGTDGLVLKPVVDQTEAEWLARTLGALPPSSEIRIIRPVPAQNGAWVVAGWSAWERLVGAQAPERWRDELEVSDLFHSLVADVAWPDAIGRNNAYAMGDAFAWAEHELAVPSVLDVAVSALVERRMPVDVPCQLVHGDLGGNILFDEALPPAVIDVSPYWRPKRYADAILCIDSMAWHGVGEDALESFRDAIGVQMLVRALLFRLGTAALRFDGHDGRLKQELLAYEPVLTALEAPLRTTGKVGLR